MQSSVTTRFYVFRFFHFFALTLKIHPLVFKLFVMNEKGNTQPIVALIEGQVVGNRMVQVALNLSNNLKR